MDAPRERRAHGSSGVYRRSRCDAGTWGESSPCVLHCGMIDALRIAQVSPYGLDRYGGVRSHILGLGEALQARGHVVTVIAPGHDGTLGTLPVLGCGRARAVHFGGTHFDVAWASAMARRRIATERFDVMHLHAPWSPALPLQLALHFRGARVGTFHDVAGHATPAWARLLMPSASVLIRTLFLHGTISVSPLVSAYLGAGTHELIPNGVALPAGVDTAVPRAEPPTLLYVGRLEPRKDVETLLRAMSLLGAAPPPLWIIGDGPSRARLEAMQRDLALGTVTFFGAVSDAEKWRRLRLATGLVAPSAAGESFGIVLLEAMTMGTIPIAADNPGYRHVLGDEAASLRFPPGDASALAARIRRIVHDPEWRAAMHRTMTSRWPAFAWTSIAERVEATYRRALQRVRH